MMSSGSLNNNLGQEETKATDRVAKEWYDQHDKPYGQRGNWWSRLWGRYRNKTGDYRNAIGVKHDIRRLQREWLGDVSEKRVLELGCNNGTVITLELARNAKSFVGIDLSGPAISELQQKFTEQGLRSAVAVCGDFFEADLGPEPFDLIYTNSVIHHFRHRDLIFKELHRRLAPSGCVVCLEPMDTAWFPWLAHELSRPFVEDAQFNWPFQRDTFAVIRQYFDVEQVQGFMGQAQWGLALSYLPLLKPLACWLGRKGHAIDMSSACQIGPGFWQCMTVLMKLKKA